jgi:hypothetical protein
MKSGFFIQILSIAFTGVALAQSAHADQGHMGRALNARYELSHASHDKGGHRVNAIQLIEAVHDSNAFLVTVCDLI